MHTNFQLDANGEYLALVQPDGKTISCDCGPNYPIQYPDMSFGQVQAAGQWIWRYLATPTPGAANTGPTVGPLVRSLTRNPAPIASGRAQVEKARKAGIPAVLLTTNGILLDRNETYKGLVDRGVTMADLKSTLRLFARSAFDPDVHIRFRPSFFPFTEPSVEVDMSWRGGWIEMGGAGMVDPNVLRAVGYDPEEVSGFAFGLGIERICANRHKITDIREFYKNDVRFLHQF